MWNIGKCYEVHSSHDGKIYRFKVKNFKQEVGSDHYWGCLEGTSEVICLDFITHHAYYYSKEIQDLNFNC